MTSATSASQPAVVRLLNTPSAKALADLAAMFEDLQTTLRCCERLVSALDVPGPDDLLVEALWTTAVLSYARCFSPGRQGKGLTDADIKATSLKGDVLEWHKVLRQLRKHYSDPAVNPREAFSVGASQDSEGKVNGIAITGVRRPIVDDLSVRQTGAIAYALSVLVDKRITEHQEQMFPKIESMTKADLEKLPLVDVDVDIDAAAADPGDMSD
ncbi:MAG: hypothetical protein H0W01_03260 [Pseudonocardiales bacterium]|nr:hypothetical protein [Pseudonocardiales bacterium]